MTFETFEQLAKTVAPGLADLFASDEAKAYWAAPPVTGKSLELATLALLHGALQSVGANIAIPPAIAGRPDLFLARNELPQHHGAQAGHSSVIPDASDRFLAALTPKFSFRVDNRSFAVFREGFPLHALAQFVETKSVYKDRPDVVVAEGQFEITSSDGISTIKAELPTGQYLVRLREVNSGKPRLVEWETNSATKPNPLAVFECSWNKSEQTAYRQLYRYMELMPPIRIDQTLFVSAGIDSSSTIPLLHVPRTHQDVPGLVDNLSIHISRALGLSGD